MRLFLCLIAIFFTFNIYSKDSNYPLKCGLYEVSSIVNVIALTSIEAVFSPNSFSESRVILDTSNTDLKDLIVGNKFRLFSKIKIIKRVTPYQLKGQIEGVPTELPISLSPKFSPYIKLLLEEDCK